MVQELSSAFMEIVKSDTSDHMDSILEACIETLLRREEWADISELKRFMDDNENDDLVELWKQIPNIERRRLMNTYKTNDKIKGTKSGVFFRLQTLIGGKEFRRLLVGQSTVNLRKEINGGKVIIFNMAKGSLWKKYAPALWKLFVALLQAIVRKRQEIPEKARKETFLFCDEFQNVLISSTLEEILAESRKYGLGVLMAHQVIGQWMSTSLKHIIAWNTAIKVAWDSNVETMRTMAAMMGDLEFKDFKKLDKYEFFVYNKFNKKGWVKKFKAPWFLAQKKKKPPFYMNKKELKELILYMVHESWYYRKVDPSEHELDANTNIYMPDFTD